MTGNPYRFSTEHEFEENRRAFQELWEKGTGGNITGQRGVRIAYRSFTKPDGGPAIVVCNGRTENMLKYQEVIFDLFNNGYQVFILDHRGQGFSGREPDLATDTHQKAWQMGDVADFEFYADDLKKFVDTIVVPQAPQQLYLLAHSMGAAIASLYLIHHGADFDGAVLVAPMHRPRMGADWLVCTIVAALAAGGFGRHRVLGTPDYKKTDPNNNPLSHSPVRVAWFNQFTENNPELRIGPVSNRWAANACRLARRFPREAGRIRTDTLILQASADSIVRNHAQHAFCRAMNATSPGACRLISVDGAKHEILMEKDPLRQRALALALDHFKNTTRP